MALPAAYPGVAVALICRSRSAPNSTYRFSVRCFPRARSPPPVCALGRGVHVLLRIGPRADQRPERRHHSRSPWHRGRPQLRCPLYRAVPPRDILPHHRLVRRRVCWIASRCGDKTLAIDFTGVGAPIFDLFTEAQRQPDRHHHHWRGELASGNREALPRRQDPAGGPGAKILTERALRIGATLPHAATLQKELRDFRVKISKAANETYDAREGAHDDLVLSLAVALFVAEHPGYEIRSQKVTGLCGRQPAGPAAAAGGPPDVNAMLPGSLPLHATIATNHGGEEPPWGRSSILGQTRVPVAKEPKTSIRT